jgi:Transposase DDE domain group 1
VDVLVLLSAEAFEGIGDPSVAESGRAPASERECLCAAKSSRRKVHSANEDDPEDSMSLAAI